MSANQLYGLIACTFIIYIGFAFGILYLKRRIRLNKSHSLTIFIPILVSFALGMTLLMVAFAQL